MLDRTLFHPNLPIIWHKDASGMTIYNIRIQDPTLWFELTITEGRETYGKISLSR